MTTTTCKNPFALCVLLAITWSTVSGFSILSTAKRSNVATTSIAVATEVSNDFGSAMPEKEVDPHDIIGVEPDLLAIGIDPREFLEWIGTKDDLTKKIQSDFKSFSPERVEDEVGKFMMDAENVNMYIKYLKDRKENPVKYEQQALEAELSISNPKVFATYAAWLIGGVSFGAIRQRFIDPKFESGEWKGITLELPFMSKPDAAVEAASTLTSKATSVIVDGIADIHDKVDFLG
mmetsp:Transcript_11842/g.33987  ORF Transcript_11842/g.33987 Transcript_11842/m.33987 type:complete len:234 (+) Transcript_11842:190-891(+)|eukprot:CAMPEP_0172365574 /NCGR_PEP_ID=MMETSP1060-20121228/10511_1 /TAXON_ID=37318 /ORGANISM="Pseudo-nitzschia pungens, Strain cf. cingulata" /LENGTH=233 /DNA_ID=CAMNT_0013088929 /DNA_START=120 /DNA_END=821 /DNA_ORIENTATION=+